MSTNNTKKFKVFYFRNYFQSKQKNRKLLPAVKTTRTIF
nr:MAG TPA: hypothetical protein [Caudoviricetes sp.]